MAICVLVAPIRVWSRRRSTRYSRNIGPVLRAAMTNIRYILNDLQDTDLILTRLRSPALLASGDETVQVNLEAVVKRRTDLERRLDAELKREQSDLIEYKIQRGEAMTYPARAVASAVLLFQEIVTSVFDAIRSGPKPRYGPSAENLELSSMDFAAAWTGSLWRCPYPMIGCCSSRAIWI